MAKFKSHVLTTSLLGLAACAAISCGGAKQPDPLPSQTLSKVAPQIEPPPTSPALPPITEVPASRSSEIKVIDPGGNSERPLTLGEASRLAKEIKASSKPSIITIDDDNLAEYAAGGQVTIMESEPAAPALEELSAIIAQAGPAAAAGSNPPPAIGRRPRSPLAVGSGETPPGDDEGYWRGRALDLRRGWRGTVDEINQLELQSAALRQQFYAEDDPYLRDSQVKPAWDRALDRLDTLRREAGVYEAEVEAFVESGRLAGAEQGWLNEGWELEPDLDEQKRSPRIGVGRSAEPEDTLEAQDLSSVEPENGP